MSDRRTSSTGANAVTISESGAVTHWRLPSCSHVVRMLSESLPTGIAMPSAGHSSIADGADGVVEARVFAGVAAAAIQLALSFTSREVGDAAPPRGS